MGVSLSRSRTGSCPCLPRRRRSASRPGPRCRRSAGVRCSAGADRPDVGARRRLDGDRSGDGQASSRQRGRPCCSTGRPLETLLPRYPRSPHESAGRVARRQADCRRQAPPEAAATAILEVAVHKRFEVLDTVPYVITAVRIADVGEVHAVKSDAVPNPNWLRPGTPSAGQQAFGDDLLRNHRFVAIPSAVSTHSWNLIFDPVKAAGFYSLELQERFALDTRLHPPA